MTLMSILWFTALLSAQDTLSCTPEFLERPSYSPVSTPPVFIDQGEAFRIAMEEFTGLTQADALRSAQVWIATDRAGRSPGSSVRRARASAGTLLAGGAGAFISYGYFS